MKITVTLHGAIGLALGSPVMLASEVYRRLLSQAVSSVLTSEQLDSHVRYPLSVDRPCPNQIMDSCIAHRRPPLEDIINLTLLDYISNITFPWLLNETLDAAVVGDRFFRHDSKPEWDIDKIKTALVGLSELGLDNVHISDLLSLLYKQAQGSRLLLLERLTGLVLLLDQGPRTLFNDSTNARYTYHYLDIITRDFVDAVLRTSYADDPFSWRTWETAGMSLDHAALRIAMLMAPICHSESVLDHILQLRITEDLGSS